MFNSHWPAFIFFEKMGDNDQKKDNGLKKSVSEHSEIQKEASILNSSDKIFKLHNLKSKMQEFDQIKFKIYAKNLVFADGNPDSKLMFIGEAPGEDEDKLGLPFVGKSGQLLRAMLETIKDEQGKYDRSNYYITNIMPWRPPANRKPTVEETLLMLPFVLEHVSIISPSLIVLIGSVAFQAILGHLKLSITQAQGNCFELNIGGIMRKIFVVYHPSYALRVSSKKRDLWLSLLKMDELYKSLQ